MSGNCEAQARWRAAHPERFKAQQAAYRAAHRDEINARQRAAYAALTSEQKRHRNTPKPRRPIIGALAVNEAFDRIESAAVAEQMDLPSRYLLALMTRDAQIWHERMGALESLQGRDNPNAALGYEERKASERRSLTLAASRGAKPRSNANAIIAQEQRAERQQASRATKKLASASPALVIGRGRPTIALRPLLAAKRPNSIHGLRKVSRALAR